MGFTTPAALAPEANTISARLALLVLHAAERRGVSRSELLSSAGLYEEQLLAEDARIDQEADRAIWREAIARTGDRLLGVEVIRTSPPGFLGLPELLFGTSSSLGEALDVARHYMPLLHGGLQVRAETEGDEVRFVYSFPEGASSLERGPVEYFLGAMVVMGKGCVGRPPSILRLSLPHAAPATRDELARLVEHFGTDRIEFAASEPSITFDSRLLQWPSLSSSPRLHRLLREHADELMRELPHGPNFLLRARQHLLAELERGGASAAGLAQRLGLGTRTLQRRLAREGRSFADLLEGLRRELATRYLLDREMGLSEIAFRLGYRSPQSFHRAFHAWTGRAPGEWRRTAIDERGQR